MKRMKKDKVKKEKPESSAYERVLQEHDLAYYIHDRVELMHQVFSVIKTKDLRSMAPECVRRVSVDDLQELCTEELLGISSKRLCAILDGAEPPSDTESSSRSSSPPVETISLDSISSDDELLSQATRRRKKKRHNSKSKSNKKDKNKGSKSQQVVPEGPAPPPELADQSRASRAGLTVLELLELQARARAIRAQLQQEQARKAVAEPAAQTVVADDDDDEDVEIKEEEPEVVEILSSEDDEKPDVNQLDKANATSKQAEPTVNGATKEASQSNDSAKTKEKEAKSVEKKKKKDKGKKKKKDKESDKRKEDNDTGKTAEVNTNKDVAATASTRNEVNATNKVIATTSSSNDAIHAVTETNLQTNKVTKRVSDLIITVPQQISRKIKLNRSKMTVSVANTENDSPADRSVISVTDNISTTPEVPKLSSIVTKPPERLSSVISKPDVRTKLNQIRQSKNTQDKDKSIEKDDANTTQDKNKSVEKGDNITTQDKTEKKDKKKGNDKPKKAKKRVKRKSTMDNDDHDEITLQLSDSEKMDLLEDLDGKQYDKVSSTEDSGSSSSTESDSDSDTVNTSHTNTDSTEKPASPEFANKTDMIEDGTIAVEVIKVNSFYAGIEEFDKEKDIDENSGEKSEENDINEKVEVQGHENSCDQINKDIDEHSKAQNEESNEIVKAQDKENESEDSSNSSDSDSNSETSQSANDSEHDTITTDLAEHRVSENQVENNESIPISEKLGYISSDKDTEANNIEITDISDIPVINDEATCANESGISTDDNRAVQNNVTEVTEKIETKKLPTDTRKDTEIEKTATENTDSIETVEKNTNVNIIINKNTHNKRETNQVINDMSISDKSEDTGNQLASDGNIEKNPSIANETESVSDNKAKVSDDVSEVLDKTEEKQKERELSEGEVSTAESSEVEAMEWKPEVVCISDEDEKQSVTAKKKKKKEKKTKKDKKNKKNKDFHESDNQNFYQKEKNDQINVIIDKIAGDNDDLLKDVARPVIQDLDTISLGSNDDVYEILELSDDSSCYEVEGTVLSKEPTADEIAALSAKMDEIERRDIITDEQIEEHERMLRAKEKGEMDEKRLPEKTKQNEIDKNIETESNPENVSWKDRYLGSKKVKKVLSTANILNALRKKNKELKKKLEQSKIKEVEELKKQQENLDKEIPVVVEKSLEEGSIEHYNTLQGSTKYVDPVPDPEELRKAEEEKKKLEETQESVEGTEQSAEMRIKDAQIKVTGEMKKDAKQLLKIYKRLLKYNDITKQKDPNKVKKKKKKSKKKDGGDVTGKVVASVEGSGSAVV